MDEPSQPKKKRNSLKILPDAINENIPTGEARQGEDFLSRLPDELILKVLSHLARSILATKVSLVNRRFYGLCMDPSLWTSLVLPKEHILGHEEAKLLLQRCTQLKFLDLWSRWVGRNGKETLHMPEFAILALQCSPSLETLRLYGVTTSILRAIAEHGLCLRQLILSNFSDDDVLSETPGCLKNLTFINVYLGLNDRNLKTIADHGKNLKEFVLSGSGLSKEAVAYFLDATRTSIRSLLVWGLLPMDSLQSINRCQLLEVLRVQYVSLSSAELDSISKLSRLTHLNIRGSLSLSRNDFLRAFDGKKLASLKRLELFYKSGAVDDEVMEVVAQNCPALTHLALANVFPSNTPGMKVTDVGIRHILQRCGNLRSLHFERLDELTDGILAEIPNRRLKSLRVYNCSKITPEGLKEAEKRCHW